MTALNTQIEGTHYTDMPLQPLELTYMIGGTPGFCKLTKYGSRDKGDKLINLNKALHCVKYEQEMQERYPSRMAESYPSSFEYSNVEVANKLIEIFTKDDLLADAMKAMYRGDYDIAIRIVELMIERESGQ